MRIAYICGSFFSHSETFVRDLAVGLTEAGHNVRLMVDRVSSRGAQEVGLDISKTPYMRRPSIFSRGVSRIADKWLGIRFMGRQRLDLRYSQYVLGKALKEYRPDVVYADYGEIGIHAYEAASAIGLPVVVHFHGLDASCSLQHQDYRDAVGKMIEGGAHIVVPSQHIRRLLLIEYGLNSPISVVPYHPCHDRNITAIPVTATQWPSVVSLGRLTGKKSPLALLEAFRLVTDRIPDAKLTMLGDGPLRDRVNERIHRLGLSEAVRLVGALEHAEAIRILRSHWVFAQHSVTSREGDQEGLPVAILEAMLLGIPVVSTIHSGIPEVIEHGESGLLCREHDYETMADLICTLLTDAGMRNRLATAARSRVDSLATSIPRVPTIFSILRDAAGGID